MNHESETTFVTSTDVTVIVRTTGERTLDSCRKLLTEQIPEDNILVIQEAPANKMVRCMHERAIEQGRRWTLAVDADVLVRSHAVAELLQCGETAHDDVFVISSKNVDKLAGGPRPVGLRLYRTSLCEKALQYIPGERVVRFDSHIINAMEAIGHPQIIIDTVTGLHDFEQSYADLYRKGFQHAQKYREMASLYEGYWSSYADSDPDYRIALWGLRFGLVYDGIYTGKYVTDVRKFPQQVDTLLAFEDLANKDPLPASAYSGDDIKAIIDRWTPPPEYYDWIQVNKAGTYWQNPRMRLVNEGLRKTGWLKFGPYLAGAVLKRSGNMLMNWALKSSKSDD